MLTGSQAPVGWHCGMACPTFFVHWAYLTQHSEVAPRRDLRRVPPNFPPEPTS